MEDDKVKIGFSLSHEKENTSSRKTRKKKDPEEAEKEAEKETKTEDIREYTISSVGETEADLLESIINLVVKADTKGKIKILKYITEEIF